MKHIFMYWLSIKSCEISFKIGRPAKYDRN